MFQFSRKWTRTVHFCQVSIILGLRNISLFYCYHGINMHNINIAKATMQTIYSFPTQLLHNPSTVCTSQPMNIYCFMLALNVELRPAKHKSHFMRFSLDRELKPNNQKYSLSKARNMPLPSTHQLHTHTAWRTWKGREMIKKKDNTSTDSAGLVSLTKSTFIVWRYFMFQ